MTTPTRKLDTGTKTLLRTRNGASEKIAASHITVLASCAYVVVVVFSTTKTGKGINLPVVAVDAPTVIFYVTVPYLLVLFLSFFLLLQLRLLTGKLCALDGGTFGVKLGKSTAVSFAKEQLLGKGEPLKSVFRVNPRLNVTGYHIDQALGTLQGAFAQTGL